MNLNTIEKTLLVDLIKLELNSTNQADKFWLSEYKKTLIKLKNKFKLTTSEKLECDKLYGNCSMSEKGIIFNRPRRKEQK